MNAETGTQPIAPGSASTITRTELSEAVRRSALLADVTISVWGAKVSDPQLLAQVKADAGAVGDVGTLIKNLLAGADGLLKNTTGAFTAVRQLHYSLTLPWVSDPHALRQSGARLLPHLLFQTYLDRVSLQKRKAVAKLDEFLHAYPSLITQARANLGTLAPATYPSVDEVRARFRVGFDFEPIPAGSSFQGLPDDMLEQLSRGLKAKQERMVAAATSAMWEAVRERVQHIVAKLSDPEARFHASTVENVRELIMLLPGWNVAGDERASEVVEDIRAMLDGVGAKDLRDDNVARQSTAAKGQAIADKLSRWGL